MRGREIQPRGQGKLSRLKTPTMQLDFVEYDVGLLLFL